MSSPAPPTRLHRFASNAFWGMLSVLVALVSGIVISPYLIRGLGEDGYGVWSLLFSVATYFVVLDFGFRSAVVNFTARHAAAENWERIHEVVSTALGYTVAITLLCLASLVWIAPRMPDWLEIGEPFRAEFPTLFAITASLVVISFSFNIVSGCLEGLQRYSVLRRAQALILAARMAGYFVILWQGGGLLALTWCSLAAAALLWVIYTVLLKRAMPGLRLRWSLVRYSTLREMLGYGLHTSTNGLAIIAWEQAPPALIVRALSEAAVGFFALPLRLVQVPVTMIKSVTEMLNPLAAELVALRQEQELLRVATLGNRYAFVLYAPVALLMLTWGTPLMRLWIGESYALNAAPLLPFFALGCWLGLSGQLSSVGILFGIGAHRWCGWGLLGEALVTIAACLFLLDRGILPVAVVVAGGMIANRGLLSAWALCRQLHQPMGSFLWSIYGVPLLLAAPFGALLWMFENSVVATWWTLFAAAGIASLYLVPAFFLCIERPHRAAAWAALRRFSPSH